MCRTALNQVKNKISKLLIHGLDGCYFEGENLSEEQINIINGISFYEISYKECFNYLMSKHTYYCNISSNDKDFVKMLRDDYEQHTKRLRSYKNIKFSQEIIERIYKDIELGII